MSGREDPVLTSFRRLLDAAYGKQIERVLLFGSRARGDDTPGSDYDVAVFLKQPKSFWKESGRLADIETEILLDTGAVINALPFEAAAFSRDSAFMRELKRDGRDL